MDQRFCSGLILEMGKFGPQPARNYSPLPRTNSQIDPFQKKATSGPQIIQNFHLPLTIQAHQRFQRGDQLATTTDTGGQGPMALYLGKFGLHGFTSLQMRLWITKLFIQCSTRFEKQSVR